MKKAWILITAMLLLITIAGTSCDKDECPLCHQCECICPPK
jgi:hypothetical protein